MKERITKKRKRMKSLLLSSLVCFSFVLSFVLSFFVSLSFVLFSLSCSFSSFPFSSLRTSIHFFFSSSFSLYLSRIGNRSLRSTNVQSDTKTVMVLKRERKKRSEQKERCKRNTKGEKNENRKRKEFSLKTFL